jgi:hypothetical protein
MEFGRVKPEELAMVDFTLPADPKLTVDTLKAATFKKQLDVHVGCAKWGRKEWLGKIYPEKTKEANFLDEYVKHFDSIELNATFYQVYGPSTIEKWREKAATNPNFAPSFRRALHILSA